MMPQHSSADQIKTVLSGKEQTSEQQAFQCNLLQVITESFTVLQKHNCSRKVG
jgi:hypothetical protein